MSVNLLYTGLPTAYRMQSVASTHKTKRHETNKEYEKMCSIEDQTKEGTCSTQYSVFATAEVRIIFFSKWNRKQHSDEQTEKLSKENYQKQMFGFCVNAVGSVSAAVATMRIANARKFGTANRNTACIVSCISIRMESSEYFANCRKSWVKWANENCRYGCECFDW